MIKLSSHIRCPKCEWKKTFRIMQKLNKEGKVLSNTLSCNGCGFKFEVLKEEL